MNFSTLDLWQESCPNEQICSLEMITTSRRYLNEAHFRRPINIDPLQCDLDEMWREEGIVGYICRPSGEDDAIKFWNWPTKL